MDNRVSFTSYDEEVKANFRKLYQALLTDDEESLILFQRYRPYVNEPLALQMCVARMTGGDADLQAFIARLSMNEDPYHRQLLDILLGSEPVNCAGTLLSDVQPQEICWLWLLRLALGKIHLLDGHPGLGKSLLLADLGARVTRGLNLPGDSRCLPTGGVVVIAPEDSAGNTIYHRFARAGADLSKVVDLTMVTDLSMVPAYKYGDGFAEAAYRYEEYSREFNIEEGDKHRIRRPFQLTTDLDLLEAAIRRVEARLLVIDPIMALAGDTDMYRDDSVRALLLPLKQLVEDLGVACVLVRHLTKTPSDNALLAGGGSIAFMGLARSALMVTRHPGDPSQVILSHIKSNIGPLAPAITYTIRSDKEDNRPYIVWGREIPNAQLDQLFSKGKTSRK